MRASDKRASATSAAKRAGATTFGASGAGEKA